MKIIEDDYFIDRIFWQYAETDDYDIAIHLDEEEALEMLKDCECLTFEDFYHKKLSEAQHEIQIR